MGKHTPTPWETKEGRIYQQGKPGCIAVVQGYENEVAKDAAFIVRAVNAHEELLAALHTAKARLQVAGLGVKDIERAIAKAEPPAIEVCQCGHGAEHHNNADRCLLAGRDCSCTHWNPTEAQ